MQYCSDGRAWKKVIYVATLWNNTRAEVYHVILT